MNLIIWRNEQLESSKISLLLCKVLLWYSWCPSSSNCTLPVMCRDSPLCFLLFVVLWCFFLTLLSLLRLNLLVFSILGDKWKLQFCKSADMSFWNKILFLFGVLNSLSLLNQLKFEFNCGANSLVGDNDCRDALKLSLYYINLGLLHLKFSSK